MTSVIEPKEDKQNEQPHKGNAQKIQAPDVKPQAEITALDENTWRECFFEYLPNYGCNLSSP